MSDPERIVLQALRLGDCTVDEFVTSRRGYVNSWAPVFTHLKEAGYIERTGTTRPTSHGGNAHVLRITEQGLAEL